MKKTRKILYTFIFTLIMYYFILPPINVTSPGFWAFLILVFSFYAILAITNVVSLRSIIISQHKQNKNVLMGVFTLLGILAVIFIINLFNMPLFNAKSYYQRISVVESDFKADVDEVDFAKLALLDKDSSSKLGDRVMGQMTDLVSQFYVSSLYTQINFNGQIVRVTPLEYNDTIKYFTNRNQGVSGYISVNSVDGSASLVKLDKGMRYMPSALFFEDLNRYLRIKYPMTIFGETVFEVDEEGNPYWIAQTIKYSGIGLKKEISGVVILDPITGDSKKYDVASVPSWVDHVYPSDLIIEQLDDWGKYKNGYFNSLFGQKNVVMATDGYNYLAMDDDIYLYTGITSVVSDESNIGFVLVNLRTKETKFYNVAGAEEYSAMESAKGQVQQMNYTTTFPLLINLKGQPTYLMSLKDNAGLVKMYAFVDYENYQKVSVSDASLGIVKSAQNYLGEFISIGEEKTKSIRISSIESAVIDGITYYYISSGEYLYRASIKVNEMILPFLTSGDTVTIVYDEGDLNQIISISK